ncbi:MAG TPA: type II secretion system F family protein [Actinomycetota bacterium]
MRGQVDTWIAIFVLASVLCLGEAWGRARSARVLALAGGSAEEGTGEGAPNGATRLDLDVIRSRLAAAGAAVVGGAMGLRLAGPVGIAAGCLAGWSVPRILARRRLQRREEALERQLAEVVETTALAVRSGLSIAQAPEFASEEFGSPMREFMRRLVAERAVGAPLDDALGRFGEALDSDDARLFVLILSIHLKTGGNVAGALEEVAATVEHRVLVRRELRALTAQGRISGAILGALPIGFFLVLATTSQRELAPVYRSTAGIFMLVTGLLLEGLAYLWIRRLLRVHA